VSYLFIAHDLAAVKYVRTRIGVMYLGKARRDGGERRAVRASAASLYPVLLTMHCPAIRRRARGGHPESEVPSAFTRPGGLPLPPALSHAMPHWRPRSSGARGAGPGPSASPATCTTHDPGMIRPPLRFGVVYDSATSGLGIATPRLYEEILDQVTWLDQIGLDSCGSPSITSWTRVSAVVDARGRRHGRRRTRRVRFSSDICLLPFSHPVRLARDLAVLDNLSGGRIEIGVGMGYAPHEFRGFGIPIASAVSHRGGLEVLRRCFSGERSAFTASATTSTTSSSGPGYVQPGGPPLWVAAMSEAAPCGRRASAATSCRRAPGDEVLEPCGGRWRCRPRPGCFAWASSAPVWSPTIASETAPGACRERYRGSSTHRFFAEAGRHVAFAAGRAAHSPDLGRWRRRACVRELSPSSPSTGLPTWSPGVPPGLHPQQIEQSWSASRATWSRGWRAAIESGRARRSESDAAAWRVPRQAVNRHFKIVSGGQTAPTAPAWTGHRARTRARGWCPRGEERRTRHSAAVPPDRDADRALGAAHRMERARRRTHVIITRRTRSPALAEDVGNSPGLESPACISRGAWMAICPAPSCALVDDHAIPRA